MSDKLAPTDINDADLEEAQGGVFLSQNATPTVGRISANESSQLFGDQVTIGGANPFNTADTNVVPDVIVGDIEPGL